MAEPTTDDLRYWTDPPEGHWGHDISPTLRVLLRWAADRIDALEAKNEKARRLLHKQGYSDSEWLGEHR